MSRPSGYQVVMTTFSDKSAAQKMATMLVASKLAACVQIDTTDSVYLWDGAVCQEREYRLMIKSSSDLYTVIEDFIMKHHTYELPEIIALPIEEGSVAYFKWIDKALGSK